MDNYKVFSILNKKYKLYDRVIDELQNSVAKEELVQTDISCLNYKLKNAPDAVMAQTGTRKKKKKNAGNSIYKYSQ
jgi:pantothenate kinase